MAVGSDLEMLRAGIAELAVLDVGSVADGELHELVVSVTRERDRLALAHARLLVAWNERRVWADNGSRSAAHRLARETNCPVGGARRELARAGDLVVMPHVAAAVWAGSLSIGHVELFSRARDGREDAFTRDEALLVRTCAPLSFAAAAAALQYWCQRVDAEGVEREAERQRDRVHVHAGRAVDGSVVIDAVLDPVGGAAFLDELERLTRELRRVDKRDGIERSERQRRAAALVEMARRSAARPADATSPRPLFSVLLGDDSFRRLCELADGTVITPGALVPWVDDAVLESVLFDGPSTVVSVSRRRTFTGAVRRAVEVRDRRCRHRSGCDTPVTRCDVDHIVPAGRGGPTTQFNGRLLCATHNRNPELREPDLVAPTGRPLDRLDELRVRIRWHNQHYHPDDRDDLEGLSATA